MGRSRIRDSVVSLSAVTDPVSPTFDLTVSPSSPEKEKEKEKSPKIHHRFSLLKFRHASDSQLSKTAKEHADSEDPPPLPFTPPAIIATAPTSDNLEGRRKSTLLLPRRQKSPMPVNSLSIKTSRKSFNNQDRGNGTGTNTPNPASSRVTFDEPTRFPPAYGDESNSALALPITRLSESSRSDGSSGDHGLFATTTTTHTVSTTTTFFRLPRRNKDKGHLFPLPPKVVSADPSATNTPRLSTSGRASESPVRQSFSFAPQPSDIHGGSPRRTGQQSPTRPTHAALAANALEAFNASDPLVFRSNSTASSTTGLPALRGSRGRSSTMSSLRRGLDDEDLVAAKGSTRTSTSTAGRPSLGGLFTLSRLRQSSEPLPNGTPPGVPGTPGSIGSKQNSIQLPREPSIVIPERQEGDTPAKYLARLEEVVNRGALATLISKSDDEFSRHVMRSYMRRFKFFEDPLDMAVRKLLMHVELPKETQHIDRTLQSFADRYHECNPGIFASPDEAYFIAFSILILHTDVFNKNNKHKMQKSDYIKNARGQGCATEILECFYDNIAYTPFIYVEDDVDISGERIITPKPRKATFKTPSSGSLRKHGPGPVDPYTLILDGKLETLRPNLEEFTMMQDPFNYLGAGGTINHADLHRTFFKSGVIQILSSRSRPEAFVNQATMFNPGETQVGVVDMKVTKVGILWRKDTKRKKARSPWQEWGAILTGFQLYFFRNASWVRSLMHQYENHQKLGRSGTPVVFKPPLEQFKPDFLLSIDDVVALVDSQYKKHKNAFLFTRQNNYQEVFLADNENDMNDWLAKLNYAATFRTAGVRMRGVIGGSYEGKSRDTQPEESNATSSSEIRKGTAELSDDLTRQIMIARRQILAQKIAEAKDKLSAAEKALDAQVRTARHIQVLAPIQEKTREEVIEAASRLATNIRWARTDIWRLRCYRDILEMDLEEDIKLSSGTEGEISDQRQANMSPASQRSGYRNSKSGAGGQGSSGSVRPSNQPSGVKLFSMDDLFRTPSRLISKHRPKSSWELPHLTFDRDGSAILPATTGPIPHSADQINSNSTSERELPGILVNDRPDFSRAVTELTAPPIEDDHDEHGLLVEAGLMSPESQMSEVSRAIDIGSDDEGIKSPPPGDVTEGLSKVRHSLHRKLQSTHAPSHHRSRKGKDSASSAGLSDESPSINESEGLTRATGSFTVHGKKASVVTFGSDWQAISPEARLSMRKAHADEVRLSVPPPIEDDEAVVSPDASGYARTLSLASDGATTVKSAQDLTLTESRPSRSIHSSSSIGPETFQEAVEQLA